MHVLHIGIVADLRVGVPLVVGRAGTAEGDDGVSFGDGIIGKTALLGRREKLRRVAARAVKMKNYSDRCGGKIIADLRIVDRLLNRVLLWT